MPRENPCCQVVTINPADKPDGSGQQLRVATIVLRPRRLTTWPAWQQVQCLRQASQSSTHAVAHPSTKEFKKGFLNSLQVRTGSTLLILSIWPHPTGTYISTKAVCYLLPGARLRPELEFSAFVHLLSGTNFPCLSALLNPWLVFVNIWKRTFSA